LLCAVIFSPQKLSRTELGDCLILFVQQEHHCDRKLIGSFCILK